MLKISLNYDDIIFKLKYLLEKKIGLIFLYASV